MPIETDIVGGGPYAGQTVYRIDRRAYELADLELDPDEMRALQVAVAAVRTGSAAGQEAIWKLGGTLGEERPSVSAVVPDRPELPVIRSAVASRSTIEFSYRGQPRRLDPWGLLLRGGFWYVIGHDHDRDEQRTFRVDRFDPDPDGITVGEPGSYERPPSFDPRSAFPADPKEIGHDAFDGVQALVHVDHVRAAAIERELGGERVVRRDDRGIVVSVPASNLPAFRSWVLGLLEHAVVLEPVDVRERHRGLAGGGRVRQRGLGVSGPRNAEDRLRRLLVMLPWLMEVGEVPLAEVARRYDLTEAQVQQDLELVAMCGLPPFVDEMVDVFVDEGMVYVGVPRLFTRPLRLTAPEGFTLLAAGRAAMELPGADPDGPLGRGLDKLAAVLGEAGLAGGSDDTRRCRDRSRPAGHRRRSGRGSGGGAGTVDQLLHAGA